MKLKNEFFKESNIEIDDKQVKYNYRPVAHFYNKTTFV